MIMKLVVALAGAILSSVGFANMSITPDRIEVSDVARSSTVIIKHDGIAVLPAEIKKIVSGVYKTGEAAPATAADRTHFSNYSYMFEFNINEDGSITIKPKEGALEFGSYRLYVHTVYGTATALIDANPETSTPPVVPDQSENYSFSYAIELPDYAPGQLVSLDLRADSENTYTWYIDGKVHSSGLGLTSFRAVPEAGEHEISFIARDADGAVVSAWSDITRISNENVTVTTIRKKD